jgi:hypothetical protein
MRKDMSKVIVERPRVGNGWRRKGRTHALDDGEGNALRQRVPPKKTVGSKMLNENLAPLRRYLESNVGRPWNKVHSEIAKHIRPTSVVQQHVLDHVRGYVDTNTRMVDGKVVVLEGKRLTPVKESSTLFYVHPKTGILKFNRRPGWYNPRKRPKDDPDARRRDIGPMRQAHLFRDGAWWDIVLEPAPTRTETARNAANAVVKRKVELPFEDVVHARKLSDMAAEKLYGRRNVSAVSARRLTKAQRKKLELP